MTQCVKNSQCPSGNCDYGLNYCVDLSNTYDTCSSSKYCSIGNVCDSYLHRCVREGYEIKSKCGYFFECPEGQYCKSGKCVAQKGPGQSCSSYTDCQDGYGCSSGKCTERCIQGKYECSGGARCIGGFCELAKNSSSSSSSSPSTTYSLGLSPLIITLIVIGSLIGAALIIGLIVCLVIKCRRKPKGNAQMPGPAFTPPMPLPPQPMIYTPAVPIQPSPMYAYPTSPSAPDAPPPSYDQHAGSASSYGRSEKQ